MVKITKVKIAERRVRVAESEYTTEKIAGGDKWPSPSSCASTFNRLYNFRCSGATYGENVC